MENSSIKSQSKQTKEHVEVYLKNQLYQYKYVFAEKAARLGTFLFIGFLLSIIALVFIVALSMALGFFLSEVLGNAGLAFLIVSGLYILLGVIVFLGRKSLFGNPLLRMIIDEIERK